MKKEIKIGATVLVAFLIVIWGLNFLKGRNIIQVGEYYYGVYSRIDGLTKASPVFYRGFKIGSVRDIVFHPVHADRFLVTFALNSELQLPKDSKAQIYSLDLMGSKGVQFIPGVRDDLLMIGDTMNTSVMGDLKDQVSMEVLPLKDKTERLIVKLDTVLTNIDAIFSDEKQRFHASMINLNKSMQHFEVISRSLANKVADDGEISVMLKHTDTIMAMLSAQKPFIDTTFSNLASFSQQLESARIDESVEQLKLTLSQVNLIMDKLNKGEGSMGKMLSDDELYLSLNDVTTNLNRLLIDVRHNPKRYVSFSAIDLGRKSVVSGNENIVTGIVYQVVLKESKEPLEFSKQVLNNEYKVFEDYRDSKYYYTIGQFSTFDEAKEILDEVIKNFDESKVVALENGVSISVKKAKKITK